MANEELQVPGYDIEERIGRGGMASVYRARQHTFDRDVALKVLKPDLSEDELFCQRFVQESLIVAKLHHSNIVQVYDVGEFQNNFYIAMEYLHGGDLNTRLGEGLAIRDSIKIVKQAASALDFAHQKGIIHRDIKPDNIMFREDGAAVLTDFGIAKEIDSDMNFTQTGLIVGTPKYMAPEQIRGAKPSAQADIYSLGILLFQCLTNHVPFQGKDMVATAYKHFNDPVPQLPPLVSAFQPILETMLAKAPEDRYRRAMEIVEALEQLVGPSETNATNLDITEEFIAPSSELDPTIVHPHNQATHTSAAAVNDETAAMQVPPDAEEAPRERSKPPAWLLYTGTIALMLVAVIIFFTKFSGGAEPTLTKTDTPSLSPPQQNAAPPTTIENVTDNPTVKRLLAEAQIDIREKRLKKPDANNAFNKLQRVLAIAPENPEALAAMEQIAEEYAKLADRALISRDYSIANTYLAEARTAAPHLDVIRIIQTKLNRVTDAEWREQASILSMEKSLMIDGLVKSAGIDEEEGRLTSPEGDNALEKYQRILEIDANHTLALRKVKELSN